MIFSMLPWVLSTVLKRELVGCYLLSLLTEKYGQNIGLYRDDGLAAFDKTPQEIEKIKKELCKIFRENGLKITIEANKTIVNS